jgi:hypothetical protein
MKFFPPLTLIRIGLGLVAASLLAELVKTDIGLKYGNLGSNPHWVPPPPPRGLEAFVLNFPVILLFVPGCALLLLALTRQSKADDSSSRHLLTYAVFGPAIGTLTVLVAGCVYQLFYGGLIAAARELRTFPLAVLLGYALGFIPALITGYWIAAGRERRPSLRAALYRGAVVGSLYGAALASILPRQKVLDFFLFFFCPALVATAACWWITQRKPEDALASK